MPAKKAAKTTAKKAAKTKAPESNGAPADPALNSAPTKVPRKTAKKGPSTDDIAKSAYLNYRRRVENNIPGDHEHDWLEAEKQLKA